MIKQQQQKQKRYYVVKVEGLIPAVVEFRVHAESEEDAYEIYEKKPHLVQPLNPPRPLPGKIIKKKISIRDTMSALITWMRNF